MDGLNKEDKKRILRELKRAGSFGYRANSLIKRLNLDIHPNTLGRTLKRWPETKPRNPETNRGSNWILTKNAIGTPSQV